MSTRFRCLVAVLASALPPIGASAHEVGLKDHQSLAPRGCTDPKDKSLVSIIQNDFARRPVGKKGQRGRLSLLPCLVCEGQEFMNGRPQFRQPVAGGRFSLNLSIQRGRAFAHPFAHEFYPPWVEVIREPYFQAPPALGYGNPMFQINNAPPFPLSSGPPNNGIPWYSPYGMNPSPSPQGFAPR